MPAAVKLAKRLEKMFQSKTQRYSQNKNGVVWFASCAGGQQYGPVPPRPQQLAGATLVQPPSRGNFRPRSGASRAFPETIQPVDPGQAPRSRRPQPFRRVNAQPPQVQIADQQRVNLVEDVPLAAKLGAPAPSVQGQPLFQPQAPKSLTPRPVEEEVNEDDTISATVATTQTPTAFAVPQRTGYPPASTNSLLQPAPAPVPVPAPFPRPQYVQPVAYRPAAPQPVQPVQFTGNPLQGRQFVRQQARPVQAPSVTPNRPQAQQVPTTFVQANPEQAFEDEQYFRQIQGRPSKKQEPARQQTIEREPNRQQFSPRQEELVRQQPIRPQAEFVRPAPREPHAKAPQREKKPVVQTIRKYHEENEDGSITWGYENDDGTFKEETIGVDCVTRGKYGYYDPDGVKREYTYQTGIPCEKIPESEAAASDQGFIDYTNNKYVLPNGDEIDLEAMVKNRARKPVSRYRN